MASLVNDAPRPSRESSFRRERTVATLLFCVAFLSVLILGAYILIKDLGEKEVFKMLQGYSRELENSLAKIPATQTVKGFQQQKIVTTRLNDFLVEKKIFDSFELYDDKGNLVQKGDIFRHGALMGGDGEGDLKPGQARVETRNRIPIVVQVPIEPGKMGRAVLSVSQDVLVKQGQAFRNELVTKMVILVGTILLLLVAAYLYVIRVLRMTRHLEAEAQERQRLSYLGLLSSGMAHEIKNPLNSIQVNLQLLEEEMSSGASQVQAISYLQPVQKEVKRLERLVNDFLVYARPMPPRLAPVSLNQTLEELRQLVGPEARQKGIAVTVNCPSAITLMADDGLLRIAILNLVFNAIHSEKEGGSIEISASEDDLFATISVRDHGSGVPDELREKIFLIFFTDKPGGTGLGLPIARRIAETHNGTLTIEKCDGPGALFLLKISKEAKVDNEGP